MNSVLVPSVALEKLGRAEEARIQAERAAELLGSAEGPRPDP